MALSNAERQRAWRERHKGKPRGNVRLMAELAALRAEIAALTQERDDLAESLAQVEAYQPEILNVAAALALAGIGAERTMIEVWADPQLTRNTHRIEVDADSATFSMTIENIPSENPKTGRITALSIIACLRKLTAPLRVG